MARERSNALSKIVSRQDIGNGMRSLRDDELGAVNGGTKSTGFRLLAQLLSELESKEAQKLKN